MSDNQNPRSLAETFNVDVEAVAGVMEKVALEAFYDELAKHGMAPKTEEQAAQMVDILHMLESDKLAMTDPQAELVKNAYDYLTGVAGESAPSAQQRVQDELQAEWAKAAADAMLPEYAISGLVAREAKMAAA